MQNIELNFLRLKHVLFSPDWERTHLKEFLEKNYSVSIDLEAAKLVSIKTLMKVIEGDLDNEKIDMVVISKEKGELEFIPEKEINAMLATKDIQDFKASLKKSPTDK